MRTKLISIIVPVWNHYRDLTEPFIRNIMKYTHGTVDFELIIVDNGSTDETNDFIHDFKKAYKNLKVINAKRNLGFGGGNNLGYKHAKGDYICFISNDVTIKRGDWLKGMYEKCEKTPGLYGHQLVDYNTLTNFNNKPTPYITGYLMFGSREMFDNVAENGNIFDPGFGLAYFEDVDLSERCKQAGYILSGDDQLPIEHGGSKSSDRIDIGKQTQQAKRHFENKMMWKWLERTKQKRIVFFTRSSYGFLPKDYDEKGVGGAEAAFINLTIELAKKGFYVEVYNTTTHTGKYEGVHYKNIHQFKWWVYADVFVLFRTPERILPYVNAVHKIFWTCDQYTTGNWKKDTFPFVDRVIGISPYHIGYLDMVYGPVRHLSYIDLGIREVDYSKELQREPGKLLFSSVPHRGLKYMPSLFARIKKQVPSAQLYITSDYTLWGLGWPDNDKYKEEFHGVKDVHFLGKVPRKELVYHQNTAQLTTYPCDYEECFCISAMESIAGGAVPITSNLAALKTTVADSGVLISNPTGSEEYDKKFVEAAVELLQNPTKLETLRKKGRKRALENYTWGKIADKWIKVFDELEKGGENMVLCKHCDKKVRSSYLLNKHVAKEHSDAEEVKDEIVRNVPDAVHGVEIVQKEFMQLLRSKQSVEVQINGQKFEGREFEAPSNLAASIIQICQEAYGKDVLDL